jgi:hypothetical protein
VSRGRPPVRCLDCGQTKDHHGRGLCSTCHTRHRRGGTLERFARIEPLKGEPRRHNPTPGCVRKTTDPKVLIEQAIARTGSVDKAALELAEQGISWQRIKEIWVAMEAAAT